MKSTLFVALLALALAPSSRAHVAGEEMAAAAGKFLDSLRPEQRAKATFELQGDERLDWHFIPKVRKGLTLKDMTEAQRQLAHTLFRSGRIPRISTGTTSDFMRATLGRVSQKTSVPVRAASSGKKRRADLAAPGLKIFQLPLPGVAIDLPA